MDVNRKIVELTDDGESFAMALILKAEGSTPRKAGVKAVIDKTGKVAAAKVVSLKDQVMLISKAGIVTRTPVKEKDPRQGITIMGRSTQGVRRMRLDPGDKVVALAAFEAK